MTWKDIPRKVWEGLTMPHDEAQRRATEVSHRYHAAMSPAAKNVQKFAKEEYDFAKNEADKIEGELGTGGKIAMKAVEMTPQLAMSGGKVPLKIANAAYGALAEAGKDKAPISSLPSLAASAIIPGNSKLANVAQTAAQETYGKLSESFAKKKTSVATK